MRGVNNLSGDTATTRRSAINCWEFCTTSQFHPIGETFWANGGSVPEFHPSPACAPPKTPAKRLLPDGETNAPVLRNPGCLVVPLAGLAAPVIAVSMASRSCKGRLLKVAPVSFSSKCSSGTRAGPPGRQKAFRSPSSLWSCRSSAGRNGRVGSEASFGAT